MQEELNTELKEYLKGIEVAIKELQEGKLETKEYLQSSQELDSWLKERCDANSSDK